MIGGGGGLTLPQADVAEAVEGAVLLPSAFSASARPQVQFLHALRPSESSQSLGAAAAGRGFG